MYLPGGRRAYYLTIGSEKKKLPFYPNAVCQAKAVTEQGLAAIRMRSLVGTRRNTCKNNHNNKSMEDWRVRFWEEYCGEFVAFATSQVTRDKDMPGAVKEYANALI